MTAPAPYLSPTAGFFNALLRLYIRRARPVIAAQLRQLDEARNVHARLTTARDFADSDREGYIDHPYRTWGKPVTTHTLPHGPYINAIEAALTEAKMQPEQTDAFVEDSYDVAYLRGVITLTPETSGIPADRYRNGLILIWDWHTGRDEDFDRGPVWQWARRNEDGSNAWPYEPLPVPGWVAPAMLTAAVAALAHTGMATAMNSLWHDHLRAPVETAIAEWEARS